MFIEILKDSLRLMKKNLNLTQLIFILFIILTIVTQVFATIKLNIKAIPFVVIFFAVMCALFSGLFFAFKKAVDYDTDPPKTDNPFDLSPLYFTEFLQGTGQYFVKFLFSGGLVLILFVLFGFAYDYCVTHFFVIPQKFLHADWNTILTNDKTMINFANTLTESEQIKILKLSSFTFVLLSLFGLITMLYPVLLVSREENFLKIFILSFKYLFKNLPIAIITFFFFNICLAFAALINAGVSNIIIAIFAILLQCYLNVWYILTLFVYYEKVK